jgi:hypothetical protein
MSMRERTELSGGVFQIRSVIGKGTEIQASWTVQRRISKGGLEKLISNIEQGNNESRSELLRFDIRY